MLDARRAASQLRLSSWRRRKREQVRAVSMAYWGERVTTVFPRQGHYATDPEVLRTFPSADLSIDRIGDLLHIDQAAVLAAARRR